jgi:hypothetical protein
MNPENLLHAGLKHELGHYPSVGVHIAHFPRPLRIEFRNDATGYNTGPQVMSRDAIFYYLYRIIVAV